ncbi:hypothetical protein OHB54_29685 [Streptomyces sp. NBC_01007]|nr:hypothetical protein OHB54_29685 [Streptomyces sp. NBC_01007]
MRPSARKGLGRFETDRPLVGQLHVARHAHPDFSKANRIGAPVDPADDADLLPADDVGSDG